MEATIIPPPVMAFGTPWTKELGLNPAVSQRGGFFKQVSSTWCFYVRTEEGSNVTLPTPPALHSCVWQKPREVSKDALLSWQYSPSKDFFTFKLCSILSWKGTLGLSTLWSQSPKLSKFEQHVITIHTCYLLCIPLATQVPKFIHASFACLREWCFWDLENQLFLCAVLGSEKVWNHM